jgi:S1-C subfamily serine protease
VELHRYNFGLDGTPSHLTWPRVLHAEVVVADVPSDVAILRARRTPVLPYVARLGLVDRKVTPGTPVTSIGIDKGESLNSWSAHAYGIVPLDPKETGAERPFLITDRAPEHGRSGGGLFLANGDLVGVCVGRINRKTGEAIGVFAPLESIHRLIHEKRLEETIAISENWHFADKPSLRRARGSPVTPTENRPKARP